jgi:uncharacterized protein
MESSISIIIFEFFSHFRYYSGMKLDISQYYLLHHALINGFGWSRQEWYELSKALWLMDKRHENLLQKLFEECWNKLTQLNETHDNIDPIRKPIITRNSEKDSPSVSASEKRILTNQQINATENSFLKPKYNVIYLEVFQSASQETNQESGVGFSLSPDLASSWEQHSFIFSDRYLPIRLRKLQQYWRYLSRRSIKTLSPNIDFNSTIDQVTLIGYFDKFAFERSVKHQWKFHFLIDHGGSMTAFNESAERLIETFIQSLGTKDLNRWYFYNYPEDYLFRDLAHTNAITLDNWYKQLKMQPSMVFIISDGGAARSSNNEERLAASIEFLRRLHDCTSHMMWFNPMSQARWQGTSAAGIAEKVSMLALSKEGLQQLPAKLKYI